MPLDANSLSTQLQNQWLVPSGGSYPESVIVSGERFAGAVSQWFSTSVAAGFPCVTAMARRAQLAIAAAAALGAGVGPTAGQLLAAGIAAYYAGQIFGPGTATFPAALPAGVATITAALADMESANDIRADQIAQACHLMALSTIVVFPVPPGPSPSPIT